MATAAQALADLKKSISDLAAAVQTEEQLGSAGLVSVALVNGSTNFGLTPQLLEALQIQVNRDFAPVWGVHVRLSPAQNPASVQAGSWYLLITDNSDQAGALGGAEHGNQPRASGNAGGSMGGFTCAVPRRAGRPEFSAARGLRPGGERPIQHRDVGRHSSGRVKLRDARLFRAGHQSPGPFGLHEQAHWTDSGYDNRGLHQLPAHYNWRHLAAAWRSVGGDWLEARFSFLVSRWVLSVMLCGE